jgi:hypothetical protein
MANVQEQAQGAKDRGGDLFRSLSVLANQRIPTWKYLQNRKEAEPLQSKNNVDKSDIQIMVSCRPTTTTTGIDFWSKKGATTSQPSPPVTVPATERLYTTALEPNLVQTVREPRKASSPPQLRQMAGELAYQHSEVSRRHPKSLNDKIFKSKHFLSDTVMMQLLKKSRDKKKQKMFSMNSQTVIDGSINTSKGESEKAYFHHSKVYNCNTLHPNSSSVTLSEKTFPIIVNSPRRVDKEIEVPANMKGLRLKLKGKTEFCLPNPLLKDKENKTPNNPSARTASKQAKHNTSAQKRSLTGLLTVTFGDFLKHSPHPTIASAVSTTGHYLPLSPKAESCQLSATGLDKKSSKKAISGHLVKNGTSSKQQNYMSFEKYFEISADTKD